MARNLQNLTNNVFFKIITIIIILIPQPVFFSIYLQSQLEPNSPNVAWVSWYDNPQSEVYIGFETNNLEICTIRYGIDINSLSNTIVELDEKFIHTINLTGLTSDTKYYYSIEIGGEIFTKGEFRTAPLDFKPFSFVMTSDTQQKVGPGWHSHMAEILNTKNYSFVTMVGDFVEEGIKEEWNDYFKRAGPYLDTIPLVPIQGNHDKPRDIEGDEELEYYFIKYFPQSADKVKNLNEYDTHQQFYFSFNWSSVHIQVLHFPEIDVDDEGEPNGINPKDYNRSFTPDQIQWIKDDLRNAREIPFKISLFHCPITGAGFYGPNKVLIDELLPILHEYNVTASVHGHAHHFERALLENPIHPENDLNLFVVGCGGGLADIALRPLPETQVCIGSPCYTEVNVNADTLQFVTYTFEGDIVDDYTVYSKDLGGE